MSFKDKWKSPRIQRDRALKISDPGLIPNTSGVIPECGVMRSMTIVGCYPPRKNTKIKKLGCKAATYVDNKIKNSKFNFLNKGCHYNNANAI